VTELLAFHNQHPSRHVGTIFNNIVLKKMERQRSQYSHAIYLKESLVLGEEQDNRFNLG
jgi:hypothetical protein